MEQETPKPKMFYVYLDNYPQYMMLSMLERGELFTAMMEYARDRTVPDFGNSALGMAFSFSRAQIDRDFIKYHETCERNRENANKKKKSNLDQSEPVATSGSQSEPVGTSGSQDKEETEKKFKKNLNKKFNNNSKTNNNSESPEEVRLIPFGKHQNVLLSPSVFEKLKETIPYSYQKVIDRLSDRLKDDPNISKDRQLELLYNWAKMESLNSE